MGSQWVLGPVPNQVANFQWVVTQDIIDLPFREFSSCTVHSQAKVVRLGKKQDGSKYIKELSSMGQRE